MVVVVILFTSSNIVFRMFDIKAEIISNNIIFIIILIFFQGRIHQPKGMMVLADLFFK